MVLLNWLIAVGPLLLAAYKIDLGNPLLSFGIGTPIAAATSTHDTMPGSEKWPAGQVNLLFDARSPAIRALQNAYRAGHRPGVSRRESERA